jgi:predicted amidohydrolase YtcJ
MSRIHADLLLTGGLFWTVDRKRPWAEAVAIRQGRIVFVGTDAEARVSVDRHARAIRLHGQFGMPGFNDAHAHWSPTLLEDARFHGVTTVQLILDVEQIGLMETLFARKDLPVRIDLRPPIDVLYSDEKSLKRFTVSPHPRLRCNGVKACVDGMMGNSTAWLFEPYIGGGGNRGFCRQDMSEGGTLETLVRMAVRKGFMPSLHAIGDKANRLLLDLYERVISSERVSDHRFRVVHAQMVHPDDVKRFGALGLVAEVNPVHVSFDLPWIEKRIGRKRGRFTYAFRSLWDAGALMCFGSDYPGPVQTQAYSINPLLGLYGAVTRCTLEGLPKGGWFPQECLTLEEAIWAYTLGPAMASGEELTKGTIEVGKLADIVVLSKNPFDVDPSQLPTIRVMHTLVGGEVVYSASRWRPDGANRQETPRRHSPQS